MTNEINTSKKRLGLSAKLVIIGLGITGLQYVCENYIEPFKSENRIEHEQILHNEKNDLDKMKVQAQTLEGYVNFVDTFYNGRPRFSSMVIDGRRFVYPHDDPLVPGGYVKIDYIPMSARVINEKLFTNTFIRDVAVSTQIHFDEVFKDIINNCEGAITEIRYIPK